MVFSKSVHRFYYDFVWDGKPMLLQSRAIDELGHVQPTKDQLRIARGFNSIYHNNSIQTWLVNKDGSIENVEISEKGEKLYRQCQGCHAIGPDASNGFGPHLNGVFDRLSGSVEGFDYSPAYTKAVAQGLRWTDTTLDEFLAAGKGID